jgi:hypothetical protein
MEVSIDHRDTEQSNNRVNFVQASMNLLLDEETKTEILDTIKVNHIDKLSEPDNCFKCLVYYLNRPGEFDQEDDQDDDLEIVIDYC